MYQFSSNLKTPFMFTTNTSQYDYSRCGNFPFLRITFIYIFHIWCLFSSPSCIVYSLLVVTNVRFILGPCRIAHWPSCSGLPDTLNATPDADLSSQRVGSPKMITSLCVPLGWQQEGFRLMFSLQWLHFLSQVSVLCILSVYKLKLEAHNDAKLAHNYHT